MATTVPNFPCLIGASCPCTGIHSVHSNGGWRLKLRKSLKNLLCPPVFDVPSELSTIGSTIKPAETGPDDYLYLDPSEKEMEPREPIQPPQSRSYARHRASAAPFVFLHERAPVDTPPLRSTSDAVSLEERPHNSPQLEDLWAQFPALSSTMTVDEWIRENGILYGEADSQPNVIDCRPGHRLSKGKGKGKGPEQPLRRSTKENRGTDNTAESAHQQPSPSGGKGDLHPPDSATPSPKVLLSPEKVSEQQTPKTDAREEVGTSIPDTNAIQKSEERASEGTQDDTPKDYTSTDDDQDTPWTPEDCHRLDYAIRKLKKQLDPLNYSDFGFTRSHGHSMLAFSNSVRKCIITSGTFGHETERLNRFLHVMMMEAADGPHRLEFELIKYAHLDKLVEEVVQFKSGPPSLPFEQLQMIEMASDLLRYWRDRFKDSYFTLDRQRQKVVMEEMLWGLTFVAPTVESPSGWTPLGDRSLMSERDAEKAFSEGQWWLNMAAAHRDGVVGHQLDKPTKGRFGYTAIPLLMGREEKVEPDKVTYVREEKQSRKVPSLGDVPMLSLLGAKVRLLRGSGLQSPYAPAAGIRYDGVWVVSQYGHKNIDGANPKMRRLTLTLERYHPRRTMAELSEIPTPGTVDYYRVFENIENVLQSRAATAYSYLEWHSRKARAKLAKEQWQRLRTFREGVESRRRKEEEAALAKPRGKMDKLSAAMKEGKERLEGKRKEKENKIKDGKEGKEKKKAADDGKEKQSAEHRNIFPGSWEMKTLMNVERMY